MRLSAACLIGEHDFTAFRAADGDGARRVQTMTRVDVDRDGEGFLRLTFRATGFLKHMVRVIVGTLAWVGVGRIPPGRVAEILASRDRTKAGQTVPPGGLVLAHVQYDDGFGDRPRTPVEETPPSR